MTVQAENRLDQDLSVDFVDPESGVVRVRLPRRATLVLDGVGYSDLTDSMRKVQAARGYCRITDFDTRTRAKPPVVYATAGAAARVLGQGVVSGDVGTRKVVTGLVPGFAALAGAVRQAARVTGIAAGAGAITGAPRAHGRVSGLVSGAAVITGALNALANTISGSVLGAQAVSAAIRAAVRVSGLVSGSSAITGNLTHTSGGIPVTHDMVLHLDASAITGHSDGDTITTWSDISGQGNHATSGSGVYKVNQLGGKPVIHFGGTAKYTLPNIAQHIPMSVFVVYRTTDGSSRYQELLSRPYVNNEPALYASIVGAPYGSGIYWDGAAGLTGRAFGGTGYPNTGYKLASWSFTGSAVEIREQSYLSSFATGASNIAIWNAIAGQSGGVVNQDFDGDIAEIVIYNGAITTQERLDIEDYLFTKWGFCGIGNAAIGSTLIIG